MIPDGMPAELRRREQDARRSWKAFHSFAEGMTMTGRLWATATAGVLLLAGTQFARGDGDTYRLGGAADLPPHHCAHSTPQRSRQPQLLTATSILDTVGGAWP